MSIVLLLAWKAATWSVVVAAAAFVVAIAGTVVAWLSKGIARGAADAAKVSAAAASDSAAIQRQALELDQGRVARERLEHIKQLDPQWDVVEPGEAGYFRSDGAVMEGAIRNTGLGHAHVTGAWLDYNGQRGVMQTRCNGNQGGGGWASKVFVPPNAVLQMRCEISGMGIEGTARPSIYMDFEQIGADTGEQGDTIVLLRKGSDVTGRALWKPQGFRVELLP